ncbi:hypothetical protein EMCRGX_G027576 [Ephydatia muelleri]
MSLDELVQDKRWKRPQLFTKKNKPYFQPFTQQRPSVKERLGAPQQGNAKPTTATAQAVSDLRDILAQKQKSTITDLRAKIAPKETQSQQPKTAQTRIKPAPTTVGQDKAKTSQGRAGQYKPGQVKGAGKPKAAANKPLMSSTPSVGRNRTRMASSSSPNGDSYALNGEQPDTKSARNTSPTRHPPSYEDTKKITVTISGLSKPLSEPYPHRREERLAAAITRSRESRQQSYMRNRDEYVASAITSAFASDREREREAVGIRGRVYSRSPSPISQMNMEPLMTRGPPPPPAPIPRPKSYTTMTTLYISNLSDTVSRNDVAELCQVVGPLEAVYMTAPGVAEVIFKYKDDALEAYRKYNQRNLDGQPMICRVHPASRGGGRVASSGGSYGSRLAPAEPYGSDLYPHHSGYY